MVVSFLHRVRGAGAYGTQTAAASCPSRDRSAVWEVVRRRDSVLHPTKDKNNKKQTRSGRYPSLTEPVWKTPDKDMRAPLFRKCQWVCSVGYLPKYTGGIYSVSTLPNLTRVFGPAAILYRTFRKGSVRAQYRYPGYQLTSTEI